MSKPTDDAQRKRAALVKALADIGALPTSHGEVTVSISPERTIPKNGIRVVSHI